MLMMVMMVVVVVVVVLTVTMVVAAAAEDVDVHDCCYLTAGRRQVAVLEIESIRFASPALPGPDLGIGRAVVMRRTKWG